MKKYILSIAVTLTGSCGPNGGSDLAKSDKAQPIRNGFLVDMALTPAPDGKCPEGGVTQIYYYDLNGNGELDAGEDAGLAPGVDCYSGFLQATNPCETGGSQCEAPLKSNQESLRDCRNVTKEQNLMAAETLAANGKENVPLENACSQLVELSRNVSDTDVYLHLGKTAGFDDYSFLPVMINIRDLYIDGEGTVQREIRNLNSVKNLPNRILGELKLWNIDFKQTSFLDFMPQKGAKFLTIEGSHFINISQLATWSYNTKTPIADVIKSTIVTTTGPIH
ncbi:MAG: hypothetical protein WCI18_10705 [Pseudomonadota bacterium]